MPGGKITRTVCIDAQDKSAGMTAAEIRTILANIPDDMVPTVIIGLRGRIRTIRIQMEFQGVD